MAHKRHPSAILIMNDIIKIGSDKYTVRGFTKDHLQGIKLVGNRGNLQTLGYPEFEEKLARYELQIIPVE